jgi:DNA-binding transcriptional LysR family regulator
MKHRQPGAPGVMVSRLCLGATVSGAWGLPESHPLAGEDALPLEQLEGEPFVTYPSHFRSVVHDAVEDACAAHGFKPLAAHEVSETATLVSFVAAGLGVSLVPASVAKMTVHGAIYRPLAGDTTRVELAAAWRRDDDRPVLARALDIIRRDSRAR